MTTCKDTGRTRIRGAARQPLKRRSPGVTGVVSGLLVAALLGVVALNYAGIAAYINRPVTEIEIARAGKYVSEADVNRLLAPLMGAGFFELDVRRGKEILEAEPWVYAASLKRNWPRTLSVNFIEQVAIARWGESGLINQYGVVFTPSGPEVNPGLPLLNGPEGAHAQMMARYQRLSRILFPAGVRLTGLALSPRGSWQLTINEGTKVMLGRIDIEDRLQRFVDLYKARFEAADYVLNSADLRYENGIAVNTGVELGKDLAGMRHEPGTNNSGPGSLSGEFEL